MPANWLQVQLAAVPLLKAFRLSCNWLRRDPVM